MEPTPLVNDDSYKLDGSRPKKCTEKMQEAFVLRAVGLKNATIKEEMKEPSEEAVEALIGRMLQLFKFPPQQHGIEPAIAIAAKSGLLKCLLDKYRNTHAKWIVPFEQKEFTAPVVDLPCFEVKK